jgi:small nuclear ribonucleoprotein (snRNP)-like protein
MMEDATMMDRKTMRDIFKEFIEKKVRVILSDDNDYYQGTFIEVIWMDNGIEAVKIIDEDGKSVLIKWEDVEAIRGPY